MSNMSLSYRHCPNERCIYIYIYIYNINLCIYIYIQIVFYYTQTPLGIQSHSVPVWLGLPISFSPWRSSSRLPWWAKMLRACRCGKAAGAATQLNLGMKRDVNTNTWYHGDKYLIIHSIFVLQKMLKPVRRKGMKWRKEGFLESHV